MKRSFVECESNMELLRDKRHCDVTFVVGTVKERISCHKLFLVSRSPVFEAMFSDRWSGKASEETDSGGTSNRKVTEIELPDVQPHIFQIFLNYIYTGDKNCINAEVGNILYLAQKYDVATLTKDCEYYLLTHLYPFQAIIILQISEKYNLTSVYKDAAKLIAKNFETCLKTDKFLQLSKENLSKIIGYDENDCEEIKIFEQVYRWALNRCTLLKAEVTMPNLRQVLGSCLFQIRFPNMSLQEFQSFRKTNILTDKETLEVYDYILLSSGQKNKLKEPVHVFNTQPRTKLFKGLTLNLVSPKTQFKQIAGGMETDESWDVWMKTNRNIELFGLGFLGPIEKDAYYDVTLKIDKLTKNEVTFSTGKLTKAVFARKGQMLRFMLDQPIIIEGISQTKWNCTYIIEFTLKGPVTREIERRNDRTGRYNKSGTKFSLHGSRSGNEKLTEILFK